MWCAFWVPFFVLSRLQTPSYFDWSIDWFPRVFEFCPTHTSNIYIVSLKASWAISQASPSSTHPSQAVVSLVDLQPAIAMVFWFQTLLQIKSFNTYETVYQNRYICGYCTYSLFALILVCTFPFLHGLSPIEHCVYCICIWSGFMLPFATNHRQNIVISFFNCDTGTCLAPNRCVCILYIGWKFHLFLLALYFYICVNRLFVCVCFF